MYQFYSLDEVKLILFKMCIDLIEDSIITNFTPHSGVKLVYFNFF